MVIWLLFLIPGEKKTLHKSYIIRSKRGGKGKEGRPLKIIPRHGQTLRHGLLVFFKGGGGEKKGVTKVILIIFFCGWPDEKGKKEGEGESMVTGGHCTVNIISRAKENRRGERCTGQLP